MAIMANVDVAIVGAGSWGTALALLLGRKELPVRLLARHPEVFEACENVRYLPGFTLPECVEVRSTDDPGPRADLIVLAVPAGECVEARTLAPRHDILVIAAKGIEPGMGELLTTTFRSAAPDVGVLSGPNLAVEVARGVPTVALAAFPRLATAERVAELFNSPTFRVSPTTDVVGVELAGALKNVLAIGAGISDGLGFGDNTKGAFLGRGLMEIARLGAAMGARPETFLGPAGAGDLFATAASGLSRNHRLGAMLGRGVPLAEALREIGQVVEGVPTARAALRLAATTGGEYPVLATVAAVLDGRLTPSEAVCLLMERG